MSRRKHAHYLTVHRFESRAVERESHRHRSPWHDYKPDFPRSLDIRTSVSMSVVLLFFLSVSAPLISLCICSCSLGDDVACRRKHRSYGLSCTTPIGGIPFISQQQTTCRAIFSRARRCIYAVFSSSRAQVALLSSSSSRFIPPSHAARRRSLGTRALRYRPTFFSSSSSLLC